LAEARRASHAIGGLMDEACDASEAAVALQSLARAAARDGILSDQQRRALTGAAAKVARELADVVAVLGGGGDA